MTQSGPLEIEVEESGRSLTSQVLTNVQTAAWVALTDRLREHWSSCESGEEPWKRWYCVELAIQI
ncbi:hypothetical protein GE21DRAFT_1308456 [Neurospora crassa]|nr:hypothetical protein GE21DRAFT_1308456 [Neurospora crassa]